MEPLLKNSTHSSFQLLDILADDVAVPDDNEFSRSVRR